MTIVLFPSVPLPVDAGTGTTFTNLGPDIAYYGSHQSVSSTVFDGSIAVGATTSALTGVLYLVLAPTASRAYLQVNDTSISGSGSGGSGVILPWTTATAYIAGQPVTNGGATYLAVDNHTSGATFAGDKAAHWAPLPLGAEIVSAGNLGASYTLSLTTHTGTPVSLVGTLNANCALTISGLAAGKEGRLFLTQDATGSRSLTVNGSSLSIPSTANLSFEVGYFYDGTDLYIGVSGSYYSAAPAALTYDQTVLADNPVLFLPLNESAGTAAADSTGSPDPGTYTGGFTLAASGIGDGETAVALNGTTGYITVPDVTKLHLVPIDSSRPFTFEAWIKPTTGAYLMILCKGAATNSPLWEWRINPTGHMEFLSAGTIYATDTTVLTSGAWAHVVLEFTNGSPTTVVFYVNGAVSSITTSAGTPKSPDTSNPLLIGKRGDSSLFFSGSMAKIALYNYLLSTQQVARHYAAG